MTIRFRVIGSGSNGNAAYISSSDETLIIDAGLSRKRIVNALLEDHISLDSVIGVLISHSHTDHCRGLPVLCDTIRDIPIFGSEGTKEGLYSYKRYDPRWRDIGRSCQTFSFGNQFSVRSFDILPLRTIHDTKDPSAFQISINDIKISIITDTGKITKEHLRSMNESSLILIEMNHDIEALKSSKRPIWLKKRIQASHLANSESSDVFKTLIDGSTKAVFLGHLSGECNSPNLVGSEVRRWHSENQSSWDWYICKRDISGTVVRFDGQKVKTEMNPIDLTKKSSSNVSSDKKIKLDEFFK